MGAGKTANCRLASCAPLDFADTAEADNAGLKDRVAFLSALVLRMRQASAAPKEKGTHEGAEVEDGDSQSDRLLAALRDTSALPDLPVDLPGRDGPDKSLLHLPASFWTDVSGALERGGWLIDPAAVTLGKNMGRGAFGATYAGTWRGQDVAVKVVEVADLDQAVSLTRELDFLTRARSPYIVSLLGVSIQASPDGKEGAAKVRGGDGNGNPHRPPWGPAC